MIDFASERRARLHIACSTAGCHREPRAGWALCDACVLDLVAPVPPQRTVERLSLRRIEGDERPEWLRRLNHGTVA